MRNLRSLLRLAPVGIAVSLLTLVAGACSLPTNERAHVISNEAIKDLTQLPSTTTTTTVAGVTINRILFFFNGEELVAETRALPASMTFGEILTVLGDGSKEDLRNAVPPDVEIAGTTLTRNGVLVVQLADELLYGVEGNELTRAVAQIVLTAANLSSEIRSIQFMIDDKIQSVPAGPEGADTKDPVTTCDYQQFYPGQFCPVIPSTTTSTTVEAESESSVPAEEG